MRSFEHDYLLEMPISHDLVKSVRLLGEYRGRQQLYFQQSPEALETLRQVAVIQSTESSNRIEGIVVEPGRLGGLVGKKLRPKDRPEQEVAGYRDVLGEIHSRYSKFKVTTDLILAWHKALLKYTGEAGGAWKAKDNAIKEVRPDGVEVVRFQPVSALATPDVIHRLIAMHSEHEDREEVDPLFRIAAFVLDFECIHPFPDGNGRLGRLLTLLLLYQARYEVGRYISLERIVEDTKESYYAALYDSSQGWHDGNHDLRPWVGYFLGVLIAAYKEFEERVGTLTTRRGAKREMVVGAVERMQGRFTIGDLRSACPGVSDPTLRRALEDLKGEGKVTCIGRGVNAEWEQILSRK